MADEPKFLLGRGESLNRESRFRSGFSQSGTPYEWPEQKARILPMLARQEAIFDEIPSQARPNDYVVSRLTLNPQYYSRSAYPGELVAHFGLRLVGSKPVQLKPEKGRGSTSDFGIPSTVLFLAGKRTAFKSLANVAGSSEVDGNLVTDFQKIEMIDAMTAQNRVLGKISRRPELLEIVLHHDANLDADWEDEFLKFAKSSGVELQESQDYQSRGLWFMPAIANADQALKLAQFSFVRAIRPMPKFRPLEEPKIIRARMTSSTLTLPIEEPLDSSFRIAIFDGGLPEQHPFGLWATRIEPPAGENIGAPVNGYLEHGIAVTSAALFGHIEAGLQPRPYCGVDHFRVLGDLTTDRQLYSVMLYVDKILSQSTYEFATFSFGPEEIVGDDVTAWTTMLDDHFQQGHILGTIAVGNAGEAHPPFNRIQVPSDCVNALAIGAADAKEGSWSRAPYSCVGPGRAPGLIKPDVVQFGGCKSNPFKFVFPGPSIAEANGTSFSTPVIMRIASAVRAHFGTSISTLGIRALLIHSADSQKHSREEVGWGMVPDDLSAITICPDGSVRVLYQGMLDPSKVIRTEIPLPPGKLEGMVEITATFCYLCQTDPHTPGDYTRAGLGISFRPHKNRFPKPSPPKYKPVDKHFPASKSFFEGVGRKSEQALRHDAFKWDSTRHARVNMRASSLDRPVFDIHYQAREPGSSISPARAQKLPYALVVTVSAKKHADLYDKVLAAYPSLAVIRPRARLPIPIRV